MSRLVKTDREFTIADIVNDVRERGDAAVMEWSRLFDGATGDVPLRAEPAGELPGDAVLFAADAIRRWHAAQRPTDLEIGRAHV